MSFTDIGKSCPSCKFFDVANMSFNAIPENKFSRKFPDLEKKDFIKKLYGFGTYCIGHQIIKMRIRIHAILTAKILL